MNAKKIKFCVIQFVPIFLIWRCFPKTIGFVHGYYKKVVVNIKHSTYILYPVTNASFLRFQQNSPKKEANWITRNLIFYVLAQFRVKRVKFETSVVDKPRLYIRKQRKNYKVNVFKNLLCWSHVTSIDQLCHLITQIIWD